MQLNLDSKDLAMIGLGLTSVFTAWKVLSMGNVMQNQQQALQQMKEQNNEQKQQTNSTFQALSATPADLQQSRKSDELKESIQSLILMQLTKQQNSSQIARSDSIGGRRDSFDVLAEGTLSRDLLKQQKQEPRISRRRRLSLDEHISVQRILLTGGPCAGKTTAMAAISQDLTQLGFRVFVVPEAATIIMKGGAMIVSSAFTRNQGLQFQKTLMMTQIRLEDTFMDIAQMCKDQNVVVLIDRGLLDGSAYVDQDTWDSVLDEMNSNQVKLRDERYDGVLHMVTAADGAEEFYASLSNEARYESKDEAIEKDMKLRKAYMGHQKWHIINNGYKDFNAKIQAAKMSVQKMLGQKGAATFYRKFLLKKSNLNGNSGKQMHSLPLDLPLSLPVEESSLVETWIKFKTTDGHCIESSVEKKGRDRAFTYTQKIVVEKNGQKQTKRRQISASEYIELENLKQDEFKPLVSRRLCCLVDNLYLIIDWYEDVTDQPMTLIIQVNEEELKEKDERLQMPKYIKIAKDISDQEEFQPHSLARKTFKMSDDVVALQAADKDNKTPQKDFKGLQALD